MNLLNVLSDAVKTLKKVYFMGFINCLIAMFLNLSISISCLSLLSLFPHVQYKLSDIFHSIIFAFGYNAFVFVQPITSVGIPLMSASLSLMTLYNPLFSKKPSVIIFAIHFTQQWYKKKLKKQIILFLIDFLINHLYLNIAFFP